MTFKASLDTLSKGITFGIIVLFLIIGQKSFNALLDAEIASSERIIHVATLLFFVAILLGCWLYSPQFYTLEREELTIKRPIGKIQIKFIDIQEVKKLEHFETRGTLRTFGVGGLFGYFGKFYIPSLGSCTFYATQRKNKILITTKSNHHIIITPDDLRLAEQLEQIKDK